MKNKDLTFVIRVQNQARAALRSLQGDLRETGATGDTTRQKLERLRQSILSAAAAARRAIRVNISDGGSVRGGRGGSRGGGGDAGAAVTNLNSLASAAQAAAKALREIRPPRGGGGGEPGGAAGAAAIGAAASRGLPGGVGALLSVGTVTAATGAYVQLADTYKNLQARISLVTKDAEQQAAVFDEVFNIAQRSRQSLTGTTDLYTKLARAGKNLGLTQRETISITETVSKAIAVSGASAAAADAAILQLGQGLASGVLRGEEFNSVVEQTPALAEAITRGLGLQSVGALRALANEGELTADVVIGALVKQKDEVERQFGAFPVTVGQSFVVLKNSILRTLGEIDASSGAATGLSDFFVNLANTVRSPAFIEGLQSFLSTLGTVLNAALTLTTQFVTFFTTNFETIKTVVLAVAPAFLAFKINALAAAGSATALGRAASFIVGPLRSIIMFGNPFRLIVTGARGVISLFTALGSPMTLVARALTAVRAGALAAATGMRALAVAAVANPFTAIAVAIGAVIGLMLLLKDRTVEYGDQTTTVGDIMAEVFDRVLGVLQSVIAWISNAVDTVVGFFSTIVGASNDGTTRVGKGWATVINFIIKAASIFATVWATVMKGALGALGNLGKALVLLVTGDFQGAANAAGAAFASIGNAAKQGAVSIRQTISSDPFGDIIEGAAGRTRARAKKAGASAGTAGGGALDEAMGNAIAGGGKTGAGAGKAGESAAEKAAKEFKDKLNSLQGTFDPLVAKAKEFAETQAFLDKALGMSDAALKRYGFTQQDVQRIAAGVARKREEELDIMFEGTKAIREQTRLLGVSADLREDERKIIELENRAREQNVQLTTDQTAAYRSQLAALRALQAADETRNKIRELGFDVEAQTAGIGLVRGQAERQAAGITLVGRAQERSVTLAAEFGRLQRAGVENAKELVAEYERLLIAQDAIAAVNDFNERITSLDTEIRLAGVLNSERERATAILEYQNELQQRGLANTELGTTLLRDYTAALDMARAAEIAAQRDVGAGIREGLIQISEEFTNFRQQATNVVTDVFQSLNQNLVTFFETGKFSFGGFVRSIGRSLIQSGVNGIVGQITSGLGGLFGQKPGQDVAGPKSVLDQFLTANRPIPVMVTNAGAAAGLVGGLLGGAANDNGADGIIGAAATVLSTGGESGTGLLGVAEDILGAGSGAAGASGGLLGIVAGILGGAGGGGGIMGLLSGILGGLLGGAGGGPLGMIGGLALSFLPKLFADGGIMTEHGPLPLRKYSRGGIANSPQLAVFGEGSTPEAYVPVPSGRIPVEMRGNTGGGGNTVVNMNVHTSDGNSFNRSRGQIAANFANELSRQSRRNG